MVLAVTDSTGEVLGLYRMPDATVFSIDVAVAKARNTDYYASNRLVAADQVDANNDSVGDVPRNTAFTNRTFRFLAGPRFPTGASVGPGDFSILTMPGINPLTAENIVAAPPSQSKRKPGRAPRAKTTLVTQRTLKVRPHPWPWRSLRRTLLSEHPQRRS